MSLRYMHIHCYMYITIQSQPSMPEPVEGDPRHGALLRFAAITDAGARHSVTWKTWAAEPVGPLRWELRRLFPSLAYDVSKKGSRVCDRFRVLKWRWYGIADYLQLAREEHFGSSLASLAQRERFTDADAAASDEMYWVSSVGLLIFIADTSCSAKGAAKQALAKAVLTSFLQTTLSAEVIDEIGPSRYSDSIVDLCSEGVQDIFCTHVRQMRAEVQKLQGPANSAQRLYSALRACLDRLQCPAAAAKFKELVVAISGKLSANVSQWGEFDYHRTSAATLRSATTGNKLKVDPHSKRFAAEVSLMSGAAASSSAAARGMEGVARQSAAAWVQQQMAQFQALSRLVFSEPTCIALSFDAARIGQPAKDFLVAVARNLLTKQSVALPPQASATN